MKKSDYYSEITELEEDIKDAKATTENLVSFQSRLDGLMRRFEEDDSLGSDRYALYQLQATISYFNGKYGKSKRYLDYSILMNGTVNKTAGSLRGHLLQRDFKPKKEKIWWIMIISPFAGLLVIAILQMLVHFVLSTTTSSSLYGSYSTEGLGANILNILSAIVGIVAVVVLLFIPIWIIELRRVKKYNRDRGYDDALSRTKGIWIAIIFGWWYWAVYTYEVDKKKMWWNLLGIIVSVGYWSFAVWIWTIVNAVSRPAKFYALYPYYDSKKI